MRVTGPHIESDNPDVVGNVMVCLCAHFSFRCP
jgi:hypothetical protein